MPPKKKGTTALLGKAIMKRAAADKRERKRAGTGFHAADVASSSNPLQSITELTSIEEFMSSAVLADREFIAERGALTFVGDGPVAPRRGAGGEPADESHSIVKSLSIPRRPAWDTSMTAADVRRIESNAFLAWRRSVAIAEAKYTGGATQAGVAAVTPFEKNIEVWRQLWRVVEKSDVLVQIVDGRNPLMFFCEDLNAYVKEVNAAKQVLLLVNKADFLSAQQRYAWAKYFTEHGIEFRFFSAKREYLLLEELDKINMEAKAKASAGAVAEQGESVPFDPDTNTAGRGDLYAGLSGPQARESEGGAAGPVARRIQAQSGHAGKPNNRFMPTHELQRLILGEDDASSSDEESTTPPASRAEDAEEASAEDDGEGDASSAAEDAEETQTDPAIQAMHAEDPDEAGTESARLAHETLEHFRHTGDLTGLDPSDPLYPLCKVLSRDELVEFLEHRYKDVVRGAKIGAADEAARNKQQELKERRRQQLMEAREAELRRRKLMTTRLIEVGLGAQVRFGDAKDIEALETADFESDDEEDGEDASQPLVVGMVGYPNVGKSSTINALMGATANNHHAKRVAVASTPGKTKHFQTLILNDDVTLCDCPGLVFPSFVTTREEMVVNGVLPIDQLRDHAGPVRLLCQRIPRQVLESSYGIALPVPPPPQPAHRQPTMQELLETFSRARGFMAAAHAGADLPRGARVLLKDYCEGRLVYCHPPPGGWATWCPDTVVPTVVAAPTEPSSDVLAPPSGERPKGSRVTMEDNVLLPSSALRHNRPAGGTDIGVEGTVGSDTIGTQAGSATSGEHREEVDGDDGDEDDSLASDDAELDEAVLRAFSRKVILAPTADADDSADESEASAHEGEDGAGPSAAGGPDDAEPAGGDNRVPKRARKLMKSRRRRKGEGREADPYGTAATADAASRPYEYAEIAAVTAGAVVASGPASAKDLRAGVEAAGIPAGHASGFSTSRVKPAGSSKALSIRNGVAMVDAVPRTLRGQVTK